MQRVYCCCLALILLSAPPQAGSQELAAAQPDNEFLDLDLETLLNLKIDPNLASILDAHVHRAGEWMLSYGFMTMDMTERHETDAEVLHDFMVAPTSMAMEMQMASGMFAPTDRLTLMVMLPYLNLSMDHVTRMGENFSTRSSGIGDIRVTGNFVMHQAGLHRLILHGGIALPTGSIDQRGDTPAGADQKLPYPMQLGSGTYDLIPGLMYQGVTERWTWGTSFKSVIRLGKNSSDYRLGNQRTLSGWLGYAWTPAISSVVKMETHRSGDIHGADPELNPNTAPTADPQRFAEHALDLHLITEFYKMDGLWGRLRMSLDVVLPVKDSHDPTQLEPAWSVFGAIQWTF